MLTGDAVKGKKIFMRRCGQCHSVQKDAKPKRGPTLNGLFGRKAGQVPGFDFSAANRDKGECEDLVATSSQDMLAIES